MKILSERTLDKEVLLNFEEIRIRIRLARVIVYPQFPKQRGLEVRTPGRAVTNFPDHVR